MTVEEAIRHLQTYSTTNGSGQTTQAEHEEAKRIAIKALEQMPKNTKCENCPYWEIKIVEVCNHGGDGCEMD